MKPTPKNIVVTGGNSGIGLQTVRALYEEGHHVIFGSRNVQRNQEAINDITRVSGGSVKAYSLDLTKRKSIEEFANNVKSQFPHIDILVNNAGLVIDGAKQNGELGYQMTLTANHFGPFYLTYLLWDTLLKAPQTRVINVSSGAHYMVSNTYLTDLECNNKSYGAFSQYCISKMFNVLFTRGLNDLIIKNSLKTVKTACLHPGFVDTNIGGDSCLNKFIKCIFCCCSKNSQTGARTSLYLCHAPFNQIRGGEYYDSDTQWKDMDRRGRNEEDVKKLWAISEKAYGIKFQ